MKNGLKKLRKNMITTRIFLHFIRNSSGYTNQYYYRFIEIVGPEKYMKSARIRNEWDSARYSFDEKAFGRRTEKGEGKRSLGREK